METKKPEEKDNGVNEVLKVLTRIEKILEGTNPPSAKRWYAKV